MRYFPLHLEDIHVDFFSQIDYGVFSIVSPLA